VVIHVLTESGLDLFGLVRCAIPFFVKFNVNYYLFLWVNNLLLRTTYIY